MIWASLSLLMAGLLLSAFFSGSETGFYRIPRVRVLIDAQDGDLLSRGLLWLTNHPSLFVATTLIGNNLANYLCSLAIVIATVELTHSQNVTMELAAPIVLAPVLFVYGELLPKNLFFYMPYRLLRGCGPFFLFFTLLFLPLSGLLWALSKLLEWSLGESPQRLQRRLVRQELKRVLEEGHEAGLLRPSQRVLAQGIFAVANRPVTAFATPVDQIVAAPEGCPRDEVLRVARRHKLANVPISQGGQPSRVVGYVRTADVYLDNVSVVARPRSMLEIPSTSSHLAALMQMQTAGETLARVVAASGETVGLVTVDQLSEPLFRGGS